MSRRAVGQKEASVTLFPFLAVLICTMGSLIVLLVIVVQQARHQATTIAHVPRPVAQTLRPVSPAALPLPPHAAPPIEPDIAPVLQQQLDEIQWANEELASSRDRTRQRMEDQRMELSRLEDQTRQLSEQLDLLEKQADDLLASEADQLEPNKYDQAELGRLAVDIEAARQKLAAARANAEKRRRQYSLITYEGPSGTKRRPIFIECRRDGVVLQPEGIRLHVKEFQIPGPANPLAASLRTTREYLSNAGLTTTAGEPYPLLIVRPGGSSAFGACRRALKGWDDEWGYELIPDDMELAYPPVDTSLAQLLSNTIAHIRAAAPPGLDSYADTEGATYHVGQQAGSRLIRQGGSGPGFGPSAPAGSHGGNAATGTVQAKSHANLFAGQAAGSATNQSIARGAANYDGTNNGNSGANAPATYGRSTSDEGTGAANQSGTTSRNSAFPTGGAGTGGPGGPSTSGARSNGDGNSATDTSGGPAPAASTGGSASGSATAGAAGASSGGSSSMAGSIAAVQGTNWALPHAVDGSIGITRPVRVVCELMTIALLPEPGTTAKPQRIPIDTSISDAMQPLVKTIWDIIDGWGIAGPNVYWKPILQVHVQPGAEEQFRQMVSLLQDSGLEVQQRQITPASNTPR